MEISCLFCCKVFGLDVLERVERHQQVFVYWLCLQQFLLHLSSFFEISAILLENTLFDCFYFGFNVSQLFGVQCCVFCLFLSLNFLLLSKECLFLFLHSLKLCLAALDALLQLTLFCLLLSDNSHTEVQPGAIKFLLFDAVVVLETTLDEREQFLVVALHDIIDLLPKLAKLGL